MQRRFAVMGVVAAAIVLAAALWMRPAAPLPMPPAVRSLVTDVSVAFVPGGAVPDDMVALEWVAEGRVVPDGVTGLWHEWPGIAVLARFSGDRVAIGLDDPENRFRVWVDGREVAEITRAGSGIAELAGLGEGAHELRIEKLSESGQVRRILGVYAASGSPPPALPARRIDVFGDSDTVGYGVRHAGRECPGEDVFLTTDATATYPAILARRYGAVPQVVARSGIGLVRGHGGPAQGQTMSDLHDRALPSRPDDEVGPYPAAWLTLIEVGGNDFALPLAEGEPWPDQAALSADFARAFEALLRDVLRASPDRPVLVLSVPDPGVPLPPEPPRVAEALRAEGLPVSVVQVPELEREACNWHPSMGDHAQMAGIVGAEIDRMIAAGELEPP